MRKEIEATDFLRSDYYRQMRMIHERAMRSLGYSQIQRARFHARMVKEVVQSFSNGEMSYNNTSKIDVPCKHSRIVSN